MVGARVPPRSTALGTLAHLRAAGAHWRAGTTQSVLGRRTGAIRCTTCPLELVEILYTALQLLCHRQVQHTKPYTKRPKSMHRGRASTNERFAACTQRAACSALHTSHHGGRTWYMDGSSLPAQVTCLLSTCVYFFCMWAMAAGIASRCKTGPRLETYRLPLTWEEQKVGRATTTTTIIPNQDS